MFLYIHGFLSSSQSAKAQQLKQWLSQQGRAQEWICPDLPADPKLAIQLLRKQIISLDQPVKLVGSSLGGFYATILSEEFDLKAVLINPAVRAGELLKQKIGVHKAWHSSENLSFTQQDVDTLNEMTPYVIQHPNNFLLMIEKEDETLDYRQAIELYKECNQLILNGGNHSFSRFKQLITFIDEF
ncbi:YqiA/YcfP family alpha/beta fold hydrolase [Phocoenobacter skyensis]|uniref:YqiA/YcfP family alpha/beta fold hydrolase n=1 Tax=Phocoenobacter skyensis TaxID=97481 RepID=A0A1H7WJ76_9PAST|nr:YqiA/YcfP family alpha/beta fold hydrolase [Pasteurella skyensis]MDP8079241.1 YqiA/YcfP family alpha/beta fold hydrolase [Pasteurella skyensis]MDP8085149.1 YqiA/YcfP family alpha/beta fold hydrolase [Pasteurella skyensis]MDP8185066.1 YqiA/YcfP family alpha/beta fold hydrolase [Pasteurella skyensis]QLB22248.1 hypothetical protein A6B44_03145 [Pasteurella skyensis]SEM21089.1 hypothetical protein SAMN05444853_10861 [Pasteurella skyensis]